MKNSFLGLLATQRRRAKSTPLAIIVAVLTLGMASVPASAGPIDEIVFFGDSLSDTGNIWWVSGGPAGGFPPPPYNQGSGGAGPDLTGGQWSDFLGPSWSTVFASRFGLFASPSVVGGNNYAWGGARTGVNTDPTAAPWLDQQVAQYGVNVGNGLATAPTANTLASIVIGGNDVASAFGNPAATEAGVMSITNQIANLYDLGMRQFLVANVPDIGATPRFQGEGAAIAAAATVWTQSWNSELENALGALALPDAELYLLDLFGFGQDAEVLATFANTTDACLTDTSICDDPGSYVYWDPFHPSSTTHALFASQAYSLVVPLPGTIALMLFGLAALGGSARRRSAV